ncbi:MAG: hypothetical protein WAM30_11645, partial [Candidatus Dormiibacterota bacterium]
MGRSEPVEQIEQIEQDARGILQPALGKRRFHLDRHPSPSTAARFVRHYWSIVWDLGEARFEQT